MRLLSGQQGAKHRYDEDVLSSVSLPLFARVDLAVSRLSDAFAKNQKTSLAFLAAFCVLWIYVVVTAPSKPVSSNQIRNDLDKKLLTRPLYPSDAQIANFNRLQEVIDARYVYYNASLFSDVSPRKNNRKLEGVTAIFLHWRRKKGLKMILEFVSKHPYIREIIIWNNNPYMPVQPQDYDLARFTSLSSATLRIYNTPSNAHDLAKHLACSLASYDTCYFNDDDWLPLYMDALYTKYIDFGGSASGRLAGNTMPYIAWEHRRWRFDNPDINLHTGFIWLGTGTFSPKSLSKRFIAQQSVAPIQLTHSNTLVCDMYFSLWSNAYPEQVSNELVAVDVDGEEVGWSTSAGVDQWDVVYTNILDAIRKLHDILKDADPFIVPKPFPIAPSPEEHDARAPCYNGGCLLITSLTPFPHATQLNHTLLRTSSTPSKLFNPWAVGHLNDYERLFTEHEVNSTKVWPTEQQWNKAGSWHFAVDSLKPTFSGQNAMIEGCWDSLKKPKRDDYFGLMFVEARSVEKVTVLGSRDIGEWEIWTMGGDADTWAKRTLVSEPVLVTYPGSGKRLFTTTFELEPLLDPIQGHEVRKIKWVSKQDQETSVVVCSFEVDEWSI